MDFFLSHTLVDLSRLQFAFTAMFHFIFVPLTLGLAWIILIMETKYVLTGDDVYKGMTKFWGKLLGINFAMGVVTGMTMEFEFGQNWSYFSRFIGGSFGPILAIEGITAFMLEATMLGLFFFGWDKLSKKAHWVVTLLLAIGSSLSIVNILAANSWMRYPVATDFNITDMTLELKSLSALYLSELAQISVGHVAFASFTLSSIFVMGISAFYLRKNKYQLFAKKSMAIAAGFGIICVIATGFYGDENGLAAQKYEPEKMAAIEAQWETQQPPAAWYPIAFPDQNEQKNYFQIEIPDALSLITTHNLKGTVIGLKPIMESYVPKITSGYVAYKNMIEIRKGNATAEQQYLYENNKDNLGFGFLYHYVNGANAALTPEGIQATKVAAIPDVSTAFWSFRIMLAMWGIMLLALIIVVYKIFRNKPIKKYMLWGLLLIIPTPYIAVEAGWVLCENGRQPWVVHEMMPTGIGSSSHDVSTLVISLIGFASIYIALFIVELFLMFKYARLGPKDYLKKNEEEA